MKEKIDTLYVSRVDLKEEGLKALRHERGWGTSATKEYAAHTVLLETFGDALGCWRLMPRKEKRYAMVWSKERLDEQVKARVLDAQDVGERAKCIGFVRSIPVDTKYIKAGIVAGFTAYVVPVNRLNGKEEDAFNASLFTTREQAYGQWIADELQKIGAVVIGEPELMHHEVRRMSRQTQTKPRRMVRFKKPVAEVVGKLQVESPREMVHGLVRGIGRHRSFGYGMVGLKV
ncbi:MAG: type I-E CRISPR-associated protein Cas6/Cse3/CasE [Bacteroidetes bacterium]|jgi:CRISPR system Cascade subunit CasE|nr:type I-E CRISPR-associated protein Cas6/Cse3/CasE [Bacteroidota bacterium]